MPNINPVLTIAFIILIFLMIAASIIGWPLWVPFLIVAIVLIGFLFLKFKD